MNESNIIWISDYLIKQKFSRILFFTKNHPQLAVVPELEPSHPKPGEGEELDSSKLHSSGASLNAEHIALR